MNVAEMGRVIAALLNMHARAVIGKYDRARKAYHDAVG